MNINEDKNGLIWGKWKMNEKTWVLTNRWCNFCYLLLGDQEALLIDTGCGEGNVREVAESITNKPIRVVNTHGHLDHGESILFTGDEVEAGQVLMVLNDTLSLEERVQKHLEVMEELITRADEYDIICPSHNGICISKDYINDFRELDRKILSNTAKLQESLAGFGWPAEVDEDSDIAACYPASRAQYGKVSIVYR